MVGVCTENYKNIKCLLMFKTHFMFSYKMLAFHIKEFVVILWLLSASTSEVCKENVMKK